MLDQQPLLLAALLARAYKHPGSPQHVTMQGELELARAQTLACIANRVPRAAVEHVHVSGAIVSFRNITFERGVGNGVILHLDRQTLHCGIETRPLGYRPAFQRAIQFEAKVVMTARCVMQLHDKDPATPLAPGARLGRGGEFPLLAIGFQGHAMGASVRTQVRWDWITSAR